MTKVVHDTDIGAGLEIVGGKLEAAATQTTDAELAAAIAAQDAAENAADAAAETAAGVTKRFYELAQTTMSTPANIEVSSEGIKFLPGGAGLSRILIISIGKGTTTAASGYFDINPPSPGTVVKGLGIPDTAVTASGFIPLTPNAHHSLWYKMPPLGSTASAQGTWYITTYNQGAYTIDDDMLFVAVVESNLPGFPIRLFDGRLLYAGITYHDTNWQALPLAAGISNYGGVSQPARYCRRDNRVFVEGLINSASAYTASQLLATLPAGFRPANQLISVAKRHLTTCRLDFVEDGTIIIVDTDAPIPSSAAGANWINLDFSFPLN